MSVGIPFGNYMLVRRIAAGGMAEVFLARQAGPGSFARTVAVKRILPHLADEREFVTMFMDEARLAAGLTHANIAHIYEFGEVDGSHFIAMEFIDGVNLASLLMAGVTLGGAIPLEHTVRIVADTCGALHYAHSLASSDGRPLGIVHRDISPQNVMVSFNGSVKVVDFGVAKAAHHIHKTGTGVIRGKCAYMSPEQAGGQTLDGRSDLFCAGVVLYELATGEPLFPHADAIAAMTQIRAGLIRPPRRNGQPLPETLEAIIYRALATDPQERYQSGAEMQLALEAFARTLSQSSNAVLLGAFVREICGKVPSGGHGRGAGTEVVVEGQRTPQVEVVDQQATVHGRPSSGEQTTIARRPEGLDSEVTPSDEQVDTMVEVRNLPHVGADAAFARTLTSHMASTVERPAKSEAEWPTEDGPYRRRPAAKNALLLAAGIVLVVLSAVVVAFITERPSAPPSRPPLARAGSAARAVDGADEIARDAADQTPPGAGTQAGADAPDIGLPEDAEALVAPGKAPSVRRVSLAARVRPPRRRVPRPVPVDRRPRHNTASSHRPRVPRGSGFLSVRTTPWSKVYLGGRKLGDTPFANVRLPAGRHRLRLVNPTLGSHYVTVVIRADETTKVSQRLAR